MKSLAALILLLGIAHPSFAASSANQQGTVIATYQTTEKPAATKKKKHNTHHTLNSSAKITHPNNQAHHKVTTAIHHTVHKTKLHHKATSHKIHERAQTATSVEDDDELDADADIDTDSDNPDKNLTDNQVSDNSSSVINNATKVSSSMAPAHQAMEQRLVSFVHNSIASLRYSTYKLGGRVFDSAHGIYKLDCSHYVDKILQNVCPSAYSSLVSSTGSEAPSSANYYAFFSRLSSDLERSWSKVNDAKDLQAGDILVFRYLNRSGNANGGHVMVVMNKPVTDNDTLLVRVSDSAFAGHSDDTRSPHSSGVGIGTLLLKVDPNTGQPSAYAWELGAPWQSRVNIAMARPEDTSSNNEDV